MCNSNCAKEMTDGITLESTCQEDMESMLFEEMECWFQLVMYAPILSIDSVRKLGHLTDKEITKKIVWGGPTSQKTWTTQ